MGPGRNFEPWFRMAGGICLPTRRVFQLEGSEVRSSSHCDANRTFSDAMIAGTQLRLRAVFALTD